MKSRNLTLSGYFLPLSIGLLSSGLGLMASGAPQAASFEGTVRGAQGELLAGAVVELRATGRTEAIR
ncbi:MAG TPA: hypothetical protein VFD30_19595, partial [Terriglobia bacterium]|nr:hypothetical protein [Terriglobia bacterium]